MSGRVYAMVDVNLTDDPRILEVGPVAELMFRRSIGWAKRLLTDGVITDAASRRLGVDLVGVDGADLDGLCAALVAAGLWREHVDGYQIAGWSTWNKSSEQIEETRLQRQRTSLAANHKRWHAEKKSPKCAICCGFADENGDPIPEGVPSGIPGGIPNVIPTEESLGVHIDRDRDIGKDRDIGQKENNAQQAAPSEPVPSFDDFWTAYPEKKGKKDARAGWARLSAENKRLAIERLPAYIADCQKQTPPRSYQHGRTYVSRQTWGDYEHAAVSKFDTSVDDGLTEEERVEQYRKAQGWT